MEKKKYYPIRNSLTIIALFIGLTEIAVGVYFSKAPANYQTPLVWFLVAFPIVYIVGFFVVLFYRPQNFYGPGDFKSDESYVSLYKQIVKSAEGIVPNATQDAKSKNEKPDFVSTSTETVLASIVKSLDEKVCWYLLKAKGKELSFDEHRGLLMAEIQQNDPFDSFDNMHFIGYLHCLWANFMNLLFKIRPAENDKYIIELDAKVSELIAIRLGLLPESAG